MKMELEDIRRQLWVDAFLTHLSANDMPRTEWAIQCANDALEAFDALFLPPAYTQ